MPFRSDPTASAVTGEKKTSWIAPLAALLIVLGGLAAYAGSFGGQFIYDDLGSILENPSIRHLWPPGGALTPPHGEGWTVEGRPVLNLSFAVNYAISGTGVWSYHALNLAIHILAGLALFGITRRTLQNAARARRRPLGGEGGPDAAGRTAQDATFLAFIIALLWTVHPLQTESVTYVIQRAESLMGLFYLLTLYCFIRGVESEQGGRLGQNWFALSVVACLCAMGTKEVAATLPVMVFLYDRTFIAGTFGEAWRRRWRYYLGLGATWILLAGLVISTGGNRSGSVGFGAGVAWWAYALTQFEAIVCYVRLAFWPHPLVFDYGPFLIGPAKAAPYAIVVLILVAATGYCLFRRPAGGAAVRLRPLGSGGQALGFAGAWFFGILSVTSLVPGTSEMIVERRMYLPLAAIVVLFVLALNAWLGRWCLPLCLVLAVGLGELTSRRNLDYRSDLAIWSDSVAKIPANSRAQYNLGVAFFNRGRGAEEVARYEEALRLDPNNAEAHHSLANALLREGRAADAVGHFKAALAFRPRDAGLRYDYGTGLYRLGENAEAAAQYEEALRLKPDFAEAHDNLGDALAAENHLPEAAAQYEEALRLTPGSAGAHFNLANVLSREGRFPEAVAHYETALLSAPNNPSFHRNLGMALVEAGRPNEAIAHFEAVLRLKPDDADVHHNLGVALAAVGRVDEANDQFEQATRLGGAH